MVNSRARAAPGGCSRVRWARYRGGKRYDGLVCRRVFFPVDVALCCLGKHRHAGQRKGSHASLGTGKNSLGRSLTLRLMILFKKNSSADDIVCPLPGGLPSLRIASSNGTTQGCLLCKAGSLCEICALKHVSYSERDCFSSRAFRRQPLPLRGIQALVTAGGLCTPLASLNAGAESSRHKLPKTRRAGRNYEWDYSGMGYGLIFAQ